MEKYGELKMVKAFDFPENLTWLNTQEPLSLDKLKGHVILLDFWTYCCINCIHVLNDLKYLEEKYKDEPFVVIGIHSPKFKNERDLDNIKSAIARYEINHPVLADTYMILWQEYEINVWPSFLLIDVEGNVIGTTTGEGQRDILDAAIRQSLDEGKKSGKIAKEKISIIADINYDSKLKFPGKLAIDSSNNILYVSDSNHNRILAIKLEEKDIGTVLYTVGNGMEGFTDGNFEEAKFNKPQGIVFHENALYIADTENHAIRLIDLTKKSVKTIAGTGKQGFKRKYNGKALSVSLSSPWDLAIIENYLYIAMAGNHQIWRLNLNDNTIENYAGSGKEDIIDAKLKDAALAQPSGLSYDPLKNRLYFADSEVSALRYIDLEKGLVKTLIGKGLFIFGLVNGDFNDALLQHPIGLEVSGNTIYIADTYNHAIRIANLNDNEIENLIYRPKKGVCKIGDENCDVLPLFEPNDVLSYNRKLYIADTNNHLIRIFDFNKKSLSDLYLLN
jgi:thiol-disulfide isomerase/thioredoxin